MSSCGFFVFLWLFAGGCRNLAYVQGCGLTCSAERCLNPVAFSPAGPSSINPSIFPNRISTVPLPPLNHPRAARARETRFISTPTLDSNTELWGPNFHVIGNLSYLLALKLKSAWRIRINWLDTLVAPGRASQSYTLPHFPSIYLEPDCLYKDKRRGKDLVYTRRS